MMVDLTRQIKRFCDPKYKRYDLGLPWRFNRRIVATNGRSLISASPLAYHGVRAAKTARVPNLAAKTARVPNVPNVRDLLKARKWVTEWEELQLPPVCRTCRGKGGVWERCDKCTIKLCGHLVSADRYELLRTLPKCMVGRSASGVYGENVYFRCVGGYGIITPME